MKSEVIKHKIGQIYYKMVKVIISDEEAYEKIRKTMSVRTKKLRYGETVEGK